MDSGQRLLQKDWNEKGPGYAGGGGFWDKQEKDCHSGDGKVGAPLPWCDLTPCVGRQIK